MRQLEDEFGEQVQLDWRSFLLRPRPRTRPADLEKFRAYTQSWLRPAADPDSGRFRVWQGDAGPPSHSVPPHLVAKAAAVLGDGAFQRMRDRLFEAYFSENRDITDDATLRALWREAELPKPTSNARRIRRCCARRCSSTPKPTRSAPPASRPCSSSGTAP